MLRFWNHCGTGLAILGVAGTMAVAYGADGSAPKPERKQTEIPKMEDKVVKSEDEWRKTLSAEEFRILRQKGTERAFTGKYWDHHEKGSYRCAGCGVVLFTSDTKFDSGCGWPSFTAPFATNAITTQDDFSHSMQRIEVMCSRCGGHLGHVFPDGPRPTGLRYCINSVSLEFSPPTATQPGSSVPVRPEVPGSKSP